MRILANSELMQVSGADLISKEALSTIAETSFYSTIIGGSFTAFLFMASTANTTTQSMFINGNLIQITANTFLPFALGTMGGFWVAGTILGAGICAYNSL